MVSGCAVRHVCPLGRLQPDRARRVGDAERGQPDWHHPDFFPRGGTGLKAGRPESGDWNRYKDYYIGQVRELCTNYGEIGGIWFDGWWDRPKADWGHDILYPMIHKLQPHALIGNNHHQKPFPGEDFQ